jgi:hypothetical protein
MVGSAALMLAWVAAGRAQAYFEPDLNAWDTAAGALLIAEAGGAMVDLETKEPYTLATRRIFGFNGDPRLLEAMHVVLLNADAVRLDGAAPAVSSSPPTASSSIAVTMDLAEAEEREERGRALDRDAALADKPKDPAVEAQRAKMLAELDELLKLGRDGVVKKLDKELRDKQREARIAETFSLSEAKPSAPISSDS